MTRYRTILLDLDGTIFDFGASEKLALASVLEGLALPEALPEFDAIHRRYAAINGALWKRLEQKTVTIDELKRQRFRTLFSELGVPASNGDIDAMNRRYIAALALHGILLPGAGDFVKALARRHKLVAVTNGVAKSQHARVAHSGVAGCFSGIITSEEAGAPKPAPNVFAAAVAFAHCPKAHCVAIGDSYSADMAGAMRFGVDAIWFNPGGEAPAGPAPLFTAKTYAEILAFIASSKDRATAAPES